MRGGGHSKLRWAIKAIVRRVSLLAATERAGQQRESENRKVGQIQHLPKKGHVHGPFWKDYPDFLDSEARSSQRRGPRESFALVTSPCRKRMVDNSCYKAIAHTPAPTPTLKQIVEKTPTGTRKPAHIYASIPMTAKKNPAAVRQRVV